MLWQTSPRCRSSVREPAIPQKTTARLGSQGRCLERGVCRFVQQNLPGILGEERCGEIYLVIAMVVFSLGRGNKCLNFFYYVKTSRST